MKLLSRFAGLVLTAQGLALPALAIAQTTPGYPERVLQWTVLPGESCSDIATALYGSKLYANLLERYNDVRCTLNDDLPDGVTLVVPEKITEVAPATVAALAPDVREKPPGGSWGNATTGMPLLRNHSVNTLERARADILFVDRSRIVMAAHTLVIIYGTAKESSKSQQSASIELEQGEVQAGILALRGHSLAIAVRGGGEVAANSRDTVLRNRADATTVSVFDGSAKVRAAGVSVEVPTYFGSRFSPTQPPSKPRPLPPAPRFSADSDEGVILTSEGAGVISTAWGIVERAASYRIEIARDTAFRDLVAREEVPANITAFRAERMPSGTYHVRVRVIDDEDFLGLPTPTRSVHVVAVSIKGGNGQVDRGTISVSPYSLLSVQADRELELSIDDGPFGPIPKVIDLTKREVERLNWRKRGSDHAVAHQLRYLPVSAKIELVSRGASRLAHITFHGAITKEVAERVRPRVRLRSARGSRQLPVELASGSSQWVVELPNDLSQSNLLEVQDFRGKILAVSELEPAVPAPRPATAAEPFETGPCAPWVGSSARHGAAVWAPTACSGASAALAADADHGKWGERIVLRGSTMMGPVGVEATIASALSGSRDAGDDALWFGARWRAVTLHSKWTMGPSLRLAVPPTEGSLPVRIESGWAVAGRLGRFSLLGNLGLRIARNDPDFRALVPAQLASAAVGLGYDVAGWCRTFAVIDAALLHYPWDATLGRAGLILAAETTGSVYAGWALRLAPWQDSGGYLALQLALGLRR